MLSDQWRWTAQQLREWQHDMVAKELYPLVQFIIKHGRKYPGRLIKVGTDNTGAVFSINAGGARTSKARDLMRDFADALCEYDIDVVACWVPRELNVVADLLSRMIPLDVALMAADADDPVAAALAALS